jgi:acid phosphatase
MKSTTTISAAAVLFAAPSVFAGLINYPTLPEDLTTPYQQRLAVYGPQGMTSPRHVTTATEST